MSKEHSYAYEAGYRDGAINYELDHCPACKNVADLQEVLDENAKLRELVLFANKTVEGLCEMVENSPGCFMCPLNQDEDRACGAAELYDRMRELGVEVVSE